MMTGYSIPSLKTIGVLFGCAIALFIVTAWFVMTGDADYEVNRFPPLLVGLILLFIALILFALRAINQRYPAPPQS